MPLGRFPAAVVLLLALVAVPPAARAEVPRVPWQEDPAWTAVLREAAADSGRSILLDFHAPWCGPCRLMEAMVYNEAAVVDALRGVVTVKYDIDVPANAAVRDSFAIELLPTLVWCDARGREVDRFTGYRNAQEFLDAVRRFRAEEASSHTLAERLAAAPADPALLLESADLQARRGHRREAEITYRRLVNLGPGTHPEVFVRGLLGLGLGEHRAGRDGEARDLGRRAAAAGVLPGQVAAYQEAVGDTAGLLETWRAQVAADDMDVVALDGFARAATALGTDLPEASRCAVRAVVLSDEDPAAILTLAECYRRRGLYGKALRWLDKGLAQHPDDRGLAAARDRCLAARAADPWGRGTPSR